MYISFSINWRWYYCIYTSNRLVGIYVHQNVQHATCDEDGWICISIFIYLFYVHDDDISIHAYSITKKKCIHSGSHHHYQYDYDGSNRVITFSSYTIRMHMSL